MEVPIQTTCEPESLCLGVSGRLCRRFLRGLNRQCREGSLNRLGMPANMLPKTIVGHGVPFPIPLKVPGSRIVSLIAGGM